MARELLVLVVAVSAQSVACTRSHEAAGVDADADAGIDATARTSSGDAAAGVDEPPIVIDGAECTGYAPVAERSLPCEWSDSLAGTCAAEVDGPWVEHRTMDPCTLAEASGGHFRTVLGPPVNQHGTCDFVAWRWDSGTATLHFGGSEPLARAFARTPVVREVAIDATASELGCHSVTRIELGDGTTGTHLVVAEGPPGAGRFWLGGARLEVTWVGPECDPRPWSQCGSFVLDRSADPAFGEALLQPCATSVVPAAIGGCGDLVDIPVTAGPVDCESRLRLGFTWPLFAPLCH